MCPCLVLRSGRQDGIRMRMPLESSPKPSAVDAILDAATLRGARRPFRGVNLRAFLLETAGMKMARLTVSLLVAVASVIASEFPAANPTQLAAMLKRAQAGDSVVMTDGTWKDADIVFAAKGTASKPITLRAQRPGKVVLTGRSRLRIAGEHLVVDGLWFKDGSIKSGSVIEFRGDSKTLATHCRFTHCAITDYNPPDKKTDYKWVSLYGQSHRVVGNRFCDLTGTGARAALCLMNGIPDSPLHGYFQVKRAYIASNTFARCAQTIVVGFGKKNAT